MDLELHDNLDTLHHSVNEFMDYIESHVKDNYNEMESELSLGYESEISNTELDNLMSALERVLRIMGKLR